MRVNLFDSGRHKPEIEKCAMRSDKLKPVRRMADYLLTRFIVSEHFRGSTIQRVLYSHRKELVES